MAELGTYYITIMPEMSSFTGEVKAALGTAGTTGGKSFGGKFSDVLKGSAVGTVLGNVAAKIGGTFMSGISTGIQRLDTLKNFPRVMESFGYSADEASDSVNKIMEHLRGLPTASQDVVSLTQAISDSTNDLTLASDAALGFNDMLLAAGASTDEVATASGVLNRVLGKGSATTAQWQSLMSVMPKQLDMVAESMLGTGASSMDLYDALESGNVSYNDMLACIAKLDSEGVAGMDSFYEQAKANSIGIGSSIANIQNRIGAGWANVFDAIGQTEIHDLLEGVADALKAPLDTLADGIGYLKEKIGDTKIGKNLSTIGKAIGDAFKSISDAGAEKLKPIADAMVDLIDRGLQWVVDHGDLVASLLAGIGAAMAFKGALGAVSIITGVAGGLKTLGTTLSMVSGLGDLSTAFTLAAETGGPLSGVFSKLGGVISFVAANPMVLIGTAIAAVVGGLVYFFTQTEKGREIWGKFCDGLKKFASNVAKDVKGGLDKIKQNLADNKVQWEKFKSNLSQLHNKIRSEVSAKWNAVKTAITTKANEIKTAATNKFNALKTGASNAWDSMKTAATTKWNNIKSAVANKASEIKTAATKKIGELKTSASAAWDNMKSTATSKWNNIKSAISTAWTNIKSTTTTKANEIKSAASNAWDNMKSAASSKFDSIKATITSKLDSAKSSATSKVNGIKSLITGFKATFPKIAAPVIGSIQGTVDSMKNKIIKFKATFPKIAAPVIGSISDAIQKIKEKITNFRVSFPKISGPQIGAGHVKTPHFSWSWKEIANGIVKVPKVSVSWYSKGGVFDMPSIIGIGEAGKEAALPLNRQTYGEIARGISREGGGGVTVHIDSLVVREEADINRIADALNRKIARERWAMA